MYSEVYKRTSKECCKSMDEGMEWTRKGRRAIILEEISFRSYHGFCDFVLIPEKHFKFPVSIVSSKKFEAAPILDRL